MLPICQLSPFSSSENFIIIRRRQETTNVDSSLVLQTLRWVFFSWIFNYEEKFPVFCTILLIDASDGYADDSEEKRIEKRLRTWRRWWWNFKNLLQIVSDKLSSIIVYTSKELLKLKEKCHPLHSSFEFAFFSQLSSQQNVIDRCFRWRRVEYFLDFFVDSIPASSTFLYSTEHN